MLLKSTGNVSAERVALKKWVQFHIRKFILDTCADDLQLLEVVGGGPFQFRVRFIKAFPQGAVDETVANHVFAFLSARVVQQFGDVPVGDLLDAMEVREVRPPTDEEVAESWEIHSQSTEEARRLFNLPTGDVRGADDDLNPNTEDTDGE